MAKSYVTRQNFIDWLKRKHPHTKVGTGQENKFHSPGTCPMAHFLKEKDGGGGYVEEKVYVFMGTEYDSPEWLKRFTIDVDNTESEFITAKKALEFLGVKE